jgi:hypothetical protein
MTSQETLDLVRRAEKLYTERYQENLERSHRDHFVAIEPDSGDYFIGATLSEAAAAARNAYPERRAFVLRVGHRTAVHLGQLWP